MPRMRLAQIAEAIHGTYSGQPDTLFSDYHFDSRQLAANSLFFALVSAANDGHKYLPDIARIPGAGAVVEQGRKETWPLPTVTVQDTRQAYQDLARYVRASLPDIRYIAITGSAGKTTCKSFLHQLLSPLTQAYCAPKNWNNWQGMPFALLKMPASAQHAVFELAMSSPGLGEIDLLAEILRPQLAVILNVYPVHLEFLKTLKNVATAKTEILNYLRADDLALINGDIPLLRETVKGLPGKKVYFGYKPDNDVVFLPCQADNGTYLLPMTFHDTTLAFPTSLPSQIHQENLLVALTAALHLGFPAAALQQTAPKVTPLDQRGRIFQVNGMEIVDDCYNANPMAVKKLLAWATRYYSEPIYLVLGDMLELGDQAEKYHYDTGKYLAELGFQQLITVGPLAREIARGAMENGLPAGNILSFTDSLAAGQALLKLARPGQVWIFKASRGIALEKACSALLSK